jgi:hypothetical protein
MTDDDVIQMMRQAGLTRTKYAPSFRRLIEIAAAAEREACANVCMEDASLMRGGTPPQIALMEAAAGIRARGQG